VAHLFQVGAGSGGMPVLDIVCRDPRITHVTLIEPDLYKPHNVERHPFPWSAVGQPKAATAERWLKERRPDLQVSLFICELQDRDRQPEIEQAAEACDLGICAADNEVAKFYFDGLMRRRHKPWTLGEVLSGGIGGFVHWFKPGGPCYGCVASHLQRAVETDKSPPPDYSQPGGPIKETTVPAPMAAIHAVASLHALLSLELLEDPAGFDPGFTSLLLTLKKVPDVFEEAFRPYRFRIPRSAKCLNCQTPGPDFRAATPEELDVALHHALARLGRD